MVIGGFQPFTLTDFPGRVAAIIFTQGCNFRCPFCHNGELIPLAPAHDSAGDPVEILKFLEKRGRQLDGIVITGGEPTIQGDLPEFCAGLKKYGLAIKLDTNGSNPGMLKTVFEEKLVDFVAMDIKAPPGAYRRLSGIDISSDIILESIDMIARSRLPHLFRTTLVPPLLDKEDIEKIQGMVPAGSEHVLQEFRPEKVFRPEIFGKDPCECS